MSLDAATRLEVAQALLAAYRSRKPIDPLTQTWPGLTLEDSYPIQVLQVEHRRAAGARVRGHKVGLTSAAMQRQMHVDSPDYGTLLEGMFFAEHQPIPTGAFLQPRVEPEVAFVLGHRLTGPGVTAAQAVSAIDYVLPALELIDSRIRDWQITLADTIADNASSGGVVLGSRPTAVGAVDLRLSGCVLHVNGAVAGTGAGGAVLGSPVTSLVWLANILGGQGVALEAGQVVLPGSITASVPVHPGDTVTATFAGVGTVTACFATEEDP